MTQEDKGALIEALNAMKHTMDCWPVDCADYGQENAFSRLHQAHGELKAFIDDVPEGVSCSVGIEKGLMLIDRPSANTPRRELFFKTAQHLLNGVKGKS